MKQQTLDTVGKFYSVRAGYPLHKLEAKSVTVSEAMDSSGSSRPPGNCALWMGVMEDRAVVVSAPEIIRLLQRIVAEAESPADLMAPEFLQGLTAQCELRSANGTALQPYVGRKHCCDSDMLDAAYDDNVCRLTIENAPSAILGLRATGIPDAPGYLLAEHTAFAYYFEGAPVAFAATHPTDRMSDSIGNVMVGVLDEYRGRGFGKAVISATTEAVVSQGKVAVWGMHHDNHAAMETALSVGYQQYCEVFELRYGR